jgi:hypothetical protein
MNQFLVSVLGAVVLTSVMAQKPTVVSHCKANEEVIFSCTTTKAKVISLCSSSLLTPDSGYLQYRFGPANKPELVYPATNEHPKKLFQSGTQMYSGGGSAFLKFKKGDYTYVVFDGIGRGWEKEGVVIKKSGKQIAYLPCKGAWQSEIGPDLFEKVKIPKDPDEIEFEIP